MNDDLKYIYLIEKNVLGRDNKIEKRLKVGKTKKEFQNGRLSVYESNNSPGDISLVKIIKAPEIFEDLFHIRFNSYRIINKRTGRKNEWMVWKVFIKNAFLSENIFEETCKLLWEKKEIYLSGKRNLTVKKKIIRYLQNKYKYSTKLPNNTNNINNRKNIKIILSNNLKNELDIIKFKYENCNIS